MKFLSGKVIYASSKSRHFIYKAFSGNYAGLRRTSASVFVLRLPGFSRRSSVFIGDFKQDMQWVIQALVLL